MHVLTLATSGEVLREISGAWLRWAPADALEGLVVPLGAGSLVETLAAAGYEEVDAHVFRRGGDVVVDTRDVLAGASSTAALAPLLLRARGLAPEHLRVALSPADFLDGGRGLLEALGSRRDVLGVTEIIGSEPLTLVGLTGAGARRAAVIGAEAAQDEERARAGWVHTVEQEHAPVDLLTGSRMRPSTAPGSGLGGGAGFALLTLGGSFVRDGVWAARALHLEARVRGADLVVLAVPRLDADAMGESIVTVVGECALEHAVPVVVLTARNETSRRARAGLGISQVYEIPEDRIALGAHKVAQTWSRPVS